MNFDQYEITRAGRLIQDFVIENLSNWFVRLNRKRYWGGEYDKDKLSAYQTLYACLENLSIISSPIAPFFMDKLFRDLNAVTGNYSENSVHLVTFPEVDETLIDPDLEERMGIAQTVTSMVLGLRRKVSIKVRQPLNKMMIPVPDQDFRQKFDAVKNLILTEVNVKEVEYISDTAGILVKKIKPNFKVLGPKYGKLMKNINATLASLDQEEINRFEKEGHYPVQAGGEEISLSLDDVEIISEDIPGWLVANEGRITVALDVTITDELRYEGIAREFINRIQNIRKESGYDVTDKIRIEIQKHEEINQAVEKHIDYIGSQTLAKTISLVDQVNGDSREVEIDDNVKTKMKIVKIS